MFSNSTKNINSSLPYLEKNMFHHGMNPNPPPKQALRSSEARFSYMDNGNFGISPKPLQKM